MMFEEFENGIWGWYENGNMVFKPNGHYELKQKDDNGHILIRTRLDSGHVTDVMQSEKAESVMRMAETRIKDLNWGIRLVDFRFICQEWVGNYDSHVFADLWAADIEGVD